MSRFTHPSIKWERNRRNILVKHLAGGAYFKKVDHSGDRDVVSEAKGEFANRTRQPAVNAQLSANGVWLNDNNYSLI